MNCETVRDLLPERALGAERDLAVERHLRSCAACRQEAGGLDRAAATMPFALAPVAVPPDLEERVVTTVRRAAQAPATRATRRRSLVTVLAAALALGVLLGGSVLAGREGSGDPALEAQQQLRAFDNFRRILDQMELGDSAALLGVLADPSGGPSRGSAMAIIGGRGDDRVLVMANGLAADAGTLPFSVRLADGQGHYVWVGGVERLSPTGGFTVARVVDQDLSGYVNVTVRDGRGRVVLTGALSEQASLPSPSA